MFFILRERTSEYVFIPEMLACACKAYPANLPGSLVSAHLKVTLLVAVAVAVTGVAVGPSLTSWLSSSARSSRKERDEGGDCTAVALGTEVLGK